MSVRFPPALAEEYLRLYQTCEIRADKIAVVDKIVNDLLSNKVRYQEVAKKLRIPWFAVATIHNMESSRNFKRHLHNGDPLTARTIHVPKDRPRQGDPPFGWEESAADALRLQRLDQVGEWPLSRILYQLEGYNGWGYRRFHPEVLSPYLWGCSSHYRGGKYVADGRWSDTAVSRQCGAAVLVRRLDERGEIPVLVKEIGRLPLFKWSNKVVARADELQRFLNTFAGISVSVDGRPGNKTSDAVHQLFGFRLKGDRRSDK